MSLQTVIDAVQATCRKVKGVKGAPNYAPEQISLFPFVVTYPGDGEIEFGAIGEMKALHNLIVEVHVGRKDLPIDMKRVSKYVDSIPAALMADPTLDGSCDTFKTIRYRFSSLGWGSAETIGYRFTLVGIKVRTDF